MRFEPLTEQHEVEGFSCGEASLDHWLAHHALANQQRSLSRTFVAVDDLTGHPAGALNERATAWYQGWGFEPLPGGPADRLWLPMKRVRASLGR